MICRAMVPNDVVSPRNAFDDAARAYGRTVPPDSAVNPPSPTRYRTNVLHLPAHQSALLNPQQLIVKRSLFSDRRPIQTITVRSRPGLGDTVPDLIRRHASISLRLTRLWSKRQSSTRSRVRKTARNSHPLRPSAPVVRLTRQTAVFEPFTKTPVA